MVRGRPAEVSTIHFRKVVKKLGFELASLVGGYGLRIAKACNPAREQVRDSLCCDVRDSKGFRPARLTVYSVDAVLKSCRGGKRTDYVYVNEKETGRW